MKRLYFYHMTFNTGFAPNYGSAECPYCTLACCAPKVREHYGKNFGEGDVRDNDIWVTGLVSKELERQNSLYTGMHNTPVYLMHVTEITTFESYYQDQRFQSKRPTKENPIGDNFYQKNGVALAVLKAYDGYAYFQHRDSLVSIDRDLSTPYVLISDDFYNFGGNFPDPDGFRDALGSKTFRAKYNGLEAVHEYISQNISKWTQFHNVYNCTSGNGKCGSCCGTLRTFC